MADDDDLPDDDVDVVAGMLRLEQLRALENEVPDFVAYNRVKPPASSRT